MEILCYIKVERRFLHYFYESRKSGTWVVPCLMYSMQRERLTLFLVKCQRLLKYFLGAQMDIITARSDNLLVTIELGAMCAFSECKRNISLLLCCQQLILLKQLTVLRLWEKRLVNLFLVSCEVTDTCRLGFLAVPVTIHHIILFSKVDAINMTCFHLQKELDSVQQYQGSIPNLRGMWGWGASHHLFHSDLCL